LKATDDAQREALAASAAWWLSGLGVVGTVLVAVVSNGDKLAQIPLFVLELVDPLHRVHVLARGGHSDVVIDEVPSQRRPVDQHDASLDPFGVVERVTRELRRRDQHALLRSRALQAACERLNDGTPDRGLPPLGLHAHDVEADPCRRRASRSCTAAGTPTSLVLRLPRNASSHAFEPGLLETVMKVLVVPVAGVATAVLKEKESFSRSAVGGAVLTAVAFSALVWVCFAILAAKKDAGRLEIRTPGEQR
jgi:hypothetical protein